MENNLEEGTYARLQACAISVEQYFTWDIREDKEIEKSLEQIEGISSRTETLDGSKGKITDSVEELSAISEENAASNQEVTASVQNMVTDINTVSEKAKAMSKLAAKLEEAISIFKI